MIKICCIAIISCLLILSGCAQNDRTNNNSTPTIPTQASTKPAPVLPNQAPLPPFTFQGKSPSSVKVDEPFIISFSIANNSDIPIVAAKINFKGIEDTKRIIPAANWDYDSSWGDNTLHTRDIHISKGQSLFASFQMVISRPGTYQFTMIPAVKAGDVRTIGEYVVTLVVSDTQQAKVQRQQKADLANRIDKNESDLVKASNNVAWIKAQLDTAKQQQQFALSQRDYYLRLANQYPQDRNMYVKDANKSTQEAQQAEAETNRLQSELAVAQQKYNDLKEEKASILQQQKQAK